MIQEIYNYIIKKEGLAKYQDAIRELIISRNGKYKLKLNKRYQHLRRKTTITGNLENSLLQQLEKTLTEFGAAKIIAKITLKKTTGRVYFDILLSPR